MISFERKHLKLHSAETTGGSEILKIEIRNHLKQVEVGTLESFNRIYIYKLLQLDITYNQGMPHPPL